MAKTLEQSVGPVEAVFENGVLRPLEPLALEDHQRVSIVIQSLPATRARNMRLDEQEWLIRHGQQYRGQWLALEGDQLVSHGPKASAVLDEARRKGVARPLLIQMPNDAGLPSAGWL